LDEQAAKAALRDGWTRHERITSRKKKGKAVKRQSVVAQVGEKKNRTATFGEGFFQASIDGTRLGGEGNRGTGKVRGRGLPNEIYESPEQYPPMGQIAAAQKLQDKGFHQRNNLTLQRRVFG